LTAAKSFVLLGLAFAGDPSFQAVIARYFRLSGSPGTAANTRRRVLDVDVRPLLTLNSAAPPGHMAAMAIPPNLGAP